jgi:hypothetical protein
VSNTLRFDIAENNEFSVPAFHNIDSYNFFECPINTDTYYLDIYRFSVETPITVTFENKEYFELAKDKFYGVFS